MLQTDISGDCWLDLFTLPALDIFFMDDEKNKMANLLPARLVGSAYTPGRGFEENHIFNPVTIFAVGDHEYLVPMEHEMEDGHTTESTVRLDQAKKIEERPLDYETGEPTRKIPQMKISNEKLPPEVMESLLAEAKLRCRNKPTHKAIFVLPEPN